MIYSWIQTIKLNMYIISPARQLLERKQKPVQVGILRIACPTEDIY